MAQLNNLIVTGSSRFLNKVYFSNGGTFNGNLNVNNGNININNGNLQLYGKVALQGFDNWLRINDGGNNNPFAYGIYCGNGTLRTDGEFQVGDGEHCFIANSSAITCNKSLIANAGVDFRYGASIRNAGLELYFSTPFIDFHFDNSNNDYTSRIIEGNKGVLNINGVTCSSSNLAANNVSATNVNVSSRINADAATAIFNNVYVKDELRSTTWAIDNITNLGSTFYVSPCIIFTNPSVYINSKSGTTVTLTITDNNIISSTIGGQTWTSGSKIKLMGRINTSVLGVVNGTMARQLNTTTAKTAYITLNFTTTDDCAGIEQGKTYSGSSVGDLKMMMYEVNLNVNGTTKNRPVGIRMSSYNEDKKSSIDIYDGTVDDGKPIVRMGYLGGLPAVNGENPTGYGFYAVGNAFFSGRIVSGSGKIGGFSLSNYKLVNDSGNNNVIGLCSTPSQGWAIWTGNSDASKAPFKVGHDGGLYATKATISGSITATSGKIGNCSIENGTLNITNASSNYAVFEGNGKTNGYFHIATIKIIGNYIDRAMVIGAQSRGYGYSEINLQFINANNTDPGINFFNQTGHGDWYIKKTATSTWNIYCKKSEVWGYTRILKYIDSPSVTLTWGSGNADLPASSTRATQLAGSSAWCYNNDSTYINGGNIYTGTVTANAIAANAITSDKISANAITADKITTNNIAGTNGWINLRSGTFNYGNNKLTWNGTTMTIGGWNITSDTMYINNKTGMSANTSKYAFWAGESNSKNGAAGTDAKFRVGHAGSLYAEDATIKGSINASSLTAKQYYKIYDSNGKNERTFVSWSGSMLTLGLVSQNGSPEAEIQILPGSQTVTFNGDIGATQGTIYAGSIDATGSLSVRKTARMDILTFYDYQQDTLPTASDMIYRRPIASAASNNGRVAFLQGASGNKISIRAQYGKSDFSSATFTASSSDIRLKEDVKDSSVNALSKIMQMQIREFNWKQTGVHQELGCVADELELIDPLLTVGGGYDDDGTMNIKSIDTLLLSEYAIKGIQELYKQNKHQQKRIEYLESQLKNK